MVMNAKQRRYAERAEEEMYGGVEPTTFNNGKSYTLNLLKALNYYNVAIDDKVKKKWTVDYLKKSNNSSYQLVNELSDYHFHTVGALIRLKSRNIELNEKHSSELQNRITNLVVIAQETNSNNEILKAETNKPVFNIQNRMIEKARTVSGDIDFMIDEFLFSGGHLVPLLDILKSNSISNPVASYIPKFYQNYISELTELLTGKDEQLVEGYAGISKVKIKSLLEYLLTFETSVSIHNVSNKVKKIRVSKPKPASVQVKNLKFMNQYLAYNIDSVNPIEIINSSDVWVYNTKYHKLSHYSGSNISVKGSTLTNFDPENSQSKNVRKPEVLKDYVSMSNKKLEMAFKDIKCVSKIPNGRINKDCIILKVNK